MPFEKLTDDHSPVGIEIFLDTSIHCSMLKGPLFKPRISSVLKRFQWKGASSYSKVEYGNVVLSHAEYYLNTIRKQGTLAKALDWIGNVLPAMGVSLGHRAWAFNLLHQHLGGSDEEATERAICSLRRLMKHGVRFVDDVCDAPISNGTACFWAARGVETNKNGDLEWKTPNCKRNKKRCRVDEFFQQNREKFISIKDAIDALPDASKSTQLKGFSSVIGEALTDPACLLDYKSGCHKLADAIIAVESEAFRNMFSQNSAESELLCSVFQQSFYYLPPNPEKGVQLQAHVPAS